jgi:hypothetical protein
MNSIIVVDQTTIPSSFGCEGLFVNGIHVLDVDETMDYPVQEIADSLSKALACAVKTVKLSELDLATYIAKKNGKLSELETSIVDGDDLDDWIQGYDNDDVIETIKSMGEIVESSPLGLIEALDEIEEDDSLQLYECEIGLFDMNDDPNTAFETHMVNIAAESVIQATELARLKAEANIATTGNIAFEAMDAAQEIIHK